MSHQSPHAMHPRPSRVPEHAAALGGNAVLRERVRRAMKLFLIATVWLAGLFVVIAAVTMVAVATAPIARNSNATLPQHAPGGGAAIPRAARAGGGSGAAGRSPAGNPAAGHPATRSRSGGARGDRSRPGQARPGAARTRAAPPRAAAAARTLEVYVGQGSANTSQFAIGGTGRWELAWSYDCAASGPPGTFTVSEYGSGGGRGGGPYIARRGTAGQGATWAYHDAGQHYLAIRTRCRWRLTVTSRR